MTSFLVSAPKVGLHALAVILVGLAALFILGADCAVYAAMTGEPFSPGAALDGLARVVCGLLRVCSA